MIIEKITLRNFRNYEDITLTPHEGVNLFFGSNGSGKTNLLEAIHYCALGKSHRVTGDQSTIRIGNNYAVCIVSVISGGVHREITVRIIPNETGKKKIYVDGKQIKRFSDMMGCLQCVIFSPEDLGLIREGPATRRRYLDMMISQIDREYFIALQQYRSAMENRNILLKNMRKNEKINCELLDVFEHTMAGPASVIISTRKKIIEILSKLTAETYEEISGTKNEKIQTAYHTVFYESVNIEEEVKKILRENREEDIKNGITSYGPHRDDLVLSLNKKNMKTYASQGQIRTAALSLKLAQMKVLRTISGEAPILLLDDVMSELDKERRMRLLSEICDYQTFITCTDESDLELKNNCRIYHVSNNNGVAFLKKSNHGDETARVILEEPKFT